MAKHPAEQRLTVEQLIYPRGPVIAAMLEPLDRVAVMMERKWGVNRLPRLVSPELAGKFVSAQEKLNEAIERADAEEVKKRAEIMLRGWQALDKAAIEAGHAEIPDCIWNVTREGRGYTVVLDRGDVEKVAADAVNPERVVTVGELLVAWEALRARAVIERAKTVFPGAEVKRAGRDELNDEIPF